MSLRSKIITVSIAVILLATAGWVFFKYCFVFGEGVKAGELNRIVYKGYIFKTYEGIVIQAGFNNSNAFTDKQKKGTIQSNVFDFSVKDKAVADSLMYHCAGRMVELHYKEYKGALPWRGKQKFIVDRIVAVRDVE